MVIGFWFCEAGAAELGEAAGEGENTKLALLEIFQPRMEFLKRGKRVFSIGPAVPGWRMGRLGAGVRLGRFVSA